MKTMLFCAAILVMTIGARAEDAAKSAGGKPNIIFILADDLGYGDLGCFGQKQIKTPSLDQMAKEGMRFTQFYAGCTVCAPSRCVLMTGLDVGHARIRGNAKGVTLLEKDLTVAEILKRSGYATGLIGKWGLGEEGSTGTPNRKGFDYFFGYLNQVHAHNYYPSYLWRNDQKVQLKNEAPDDKDGESTKKLQYSHDLFAAEALGFVEKHKAEPFFLYLAFTIPHAHLDPPDLGQYAGTDWPKPEKAYASMVSRMDRDIGRLFDLLKKLNIDDNTIVFFSSDNGPHHEGHNPAFFDCSGPLRGIKRDLYDGGIREPTIVRWPGKIAAGTTNDFVGGFQDFMPTAAQLVGAETPKNIDGVSFLPALLGKVNEQRQHDHLYWEFYEQGGSRAVRMGDWKAVRPKWHAPIELFDLKTDLGEKKNVAAEHPDIVKKMEAIMEASRTADPAWQPPSGGGKGNKNK